MSKNPEGDIDVLVLKFAHILKKKLGWKVTGLHKIEERTKGMFERAGIIAEIRALTIVERSIDEAIAEFRKDAENAGALYPKRKSKSKENQR